MVHNKKKTIKVLLAVILIIMLSTAYKLKFAPVQTEEDATIPEYAKGRKVVELWIKNNYYSNSIYEQIDNYNISNKDNLFIDVVKYGVDYVNVLKIKLLTSEKPDIFDIADNGVLRNYELYPLNELVKNDTKLENKKLLYKNSVKGVNIAGSVVKFAWNKEIFKSCGLDPEKGPQTWDDVLKYSKIIKSKMPDIIPFEAPFAGMPEFRRSIGEPSVNSDTVYTTFWNYKKGKYDFGSAKYMLDFYRNMYKNKLMQDDIEGSDRNQVREDFYNKKTAMFLSVYDDKIKFLTENPLYFDIGVSEIPKIKASDSQNYYFIDDTKCIGVNVHSGDKPEVKKAFEIYKNICTNQDLVTPYNYKSKYFPQYNTYDNTDKFTFENMDPTPGLQVEPRKVRGFVSDCIRGDVSTEETINNLNNYLEEVCNKAKLKDSTFFNSFKGRE